MAVYLIVEHKIMDPAKFEEYRDKVGPMGADHVRLFEGFHAHSGCCCGAACGERGDRRRGDYSAPR